MRGRDSDRVRGGEGERVKRVRGRDSDRVRG